MKNNLSPYLREPDRLTDVIAALQATATYRYYKLDFAGWADRIVGDECEAEHWKAVLSEHPEFFRLDSKRQRASLVWRRQKRKLYDLETEELITKEVFRALPMTQKANIGREPLSKDELGILISTAIDLHDRALEQTRDSRWRIPFFVAAGVAIIGVFGTFIGSILG